jgi:hypothetical protein
VATGVGMALVFIVQRRSANARAVTPNAEAVSPTPGLLFGVFVMVVGVVVVGGRRGERMV